MTISAVTLAEAINQAMQFFVWEMAWGGVAVYPRSVFATKRDESHTDTDLT